MRTTRQHLAPTASAERCNNSTEQVSIVRALENHTGSGSIQRRITEPRQVRKEAAVGNPFVGMVSLTPPFYSKEAKCSRKVTAMAIPKQQKPKAKSQSRRRAPRTVSSNRPQRATKRQGRQTRSTELPQKVIAINSSLSGVRIALLENKQLTELFWELPDADRVVGNIYLGKVRKVVPGMNAAFVNIGYPRDGFLHFSETGSSLQSILEFLDEEIDDEADLPVFSTKRSGDVTIPLQAGQSVLVQAIREPYTGKSIRLSTNLSLPGRLLVLLPFTSGIGVSRKITDIAERRRLRNLVRKMLPKGVGCVIRTEAFQQPDHLIEKDLKNLLHTWEQIQEKAKNAQDPQLLHRDASFVHTLVRDFFRSDIEQLIVDSKKLYREIINYLQDIAPQMVGRVKLYRGKRSLFEHLNITADIEQCYSREVSLPSGGSIVFDHTEAMLVVDVNSRKSSEGKRSQEEVAFRTNLEAAYEIARQLRLRDIGGLIVIDFIDMKQETHRKQLYETMKNLLQKDRAVTVVFPLTNLSLMQITRQRIRKNIAQILTRECPTCHGRGTVTSVHLTLNYIENWLRHFRNQSREFRLILTVHPSVAEYLQTGKISRLVRLMLKYFVKLTLQVDPFLPVNQFRFFSIKQNADITDLFRQA